MCAVAALPAVMSVAGSVAKGVQANIAGSAQESANKKIAERNQRLARESAQSQYQQVNEKVYQEAARAGQEVAEVTRDSLDARSKLVASAAESGVSGASLDALLADFERQEGNFLAANKLNQEFVGQQAEADKKGIRIGLESRLVASTPPVVNKPGFGGILISGALAGASTYANQLYSESQN